MLPLWMPFVIFANESVQFEFEIISRKHPVKRKIVMEIVTAREFRSNQGKFLTAAMRGQSVLLTSRYGNFRIIPLTSEDEIVKKNFRDAYSEVQAHMEGKKTLPLAKDVVF